MTNRRVTQGECPRKSKYSDAEKVAFSRSYYKQPFRVVYSVKKRGFSKYVIIDASEKLCAGREFLLHCVEALNAYEQNRTKND